MNTKTRWSAEPLADHLLHVGNLHAIQVLAGSSDFSDELGARDVAQHAGACVELISKGILAREHPALILEQRNWATELPKVGTASEWAKLTTLKASTALDNACALLGIKKRPTTSAILAKRNAAVHIGVGPENVNKLILELALWLHDIRAKEVQLDSDVEYAVRRQVSKLEVSVSAKVASAAKRVKLIPDVLGLRFAQEPAAASDENDKVECPACRNPAEYFSTIVDVETEYEGPGEYSQYPIWEHELRCPYCELGLDDTELQGLDKEIKLLSSEIQPHKIPSF